jgi:SAM-dependent methyltransferase
LADGLFDVVFLGSLFTHLLPAEVENYLSEIARVMKPGGWCIISYFILERGIIKRRAGKADWPGFEYEGDGYRTTNPEVPEEAIAYEEKYLRQIYENFGLTVVEPIHYGSQDVIVGVKD